MDWYCYTRWDNDWCLVGRMIFQELIDSQSSDEQVWMTQLSFSFVTRSEKDEDTLVERRYTMDYAKEWDKWVLHEYEERQSENMSPGRRNWHRVRHMYWDSGESPDVEIPPAVSKQLEEVLGQSVNIQEP